MATLWIGDTDGRRDRRCGEHVGPATAGAATADDTAADDAATTDAAANHATAADDEPRRSIRRTWCGRRTWPRHAAATAARSAGGDAGAGEADRFGDCADA